MRTAECGTEWVISIERNVMFSMWMDQCIQKRKSLAVSGTRQTVTISDIWLFAKQRSIPTSTSPKLVYFTYFMALQCSVNEKWQKLQQAKVCACLCLGVRVCRPRDKAH